MKNISISPKISLVVGLLLVIVPQIIFETPGVIFEFVQLLGLILIVVGSAGLMGSFLRKKKGIEQVNEKEDVSKFKFSKHIAYILSIALLAVFLLGWQDPVSIFWPAILLFVFTLVFNGGIGGKRIQDRLPFYLAMISFLGFFIMALLSTM